MYLAILLSASFVGRIVSPILGCPVGLVIFSFFVKKFGLFSMSFVYLITICLTRPEDIVWYMNYFVQTYNVGWLEAIPMALGFQLLIILWVMALTYRVLVKAKAFRLEF